MNPLLLHRLRRRLRRRHKIMMPGQSHPYAAHAGRCDEEEPPPPKKMKRLVFLMLFVIALAVAVGSLNSCMEVTTTAPDGTVTRTKSPAPGSMELIGQGIAVVAHRREQKSISPVEAKENSTAAMPNPLDTIELDWHSPAWGVWGPGGNGPPYRPELTAR